MAVQTSPHDTLTDLVDAAVPGVEQETGESPGEAISKKCAHLCAV